MLINFIKIQLILKQIRTFQQQSSLHDKDFSFFLIPFLNPLMKKQTKLMLKYLLKKSMLVCLKIYFLNYSLFKKIDTTSFQIGDPNYLLQWHTQVPLMISIKQSQSTIDQFYV
ncbi:unnamed protein product [Paramecium pentaurelia]|uniref:Uncharacterized protein n=1 Tax=Paramecium pentaurelia TaxID=43138 RepID=A0A8S1WKM6_9CILI|nr:unnamed protein product [Paramecium pentaurelia]